MSDMDGVMARLSKKYPVMYANSDKSPCKVKGWISTGCAALDAILGGGLPMGRILEIFGDTSTGKTLIGLQAVASAQRAGIECVYLDTERAASLDLMTMVGVDAGKLIYADPDTIEDVFGLMEEFTVSKPKDAKMLIVWDSVAATTALAEKDNDYGKASMGKHANLISQGLRKFNPIIARNDVAALFINQTRQNIGIMFGDDETTFGGKAIPFYSSIRLRLKQGKRLKDGDDVIGVMTTGQTVKNKLFAPYKEAALPIYFDVGIDDAEASLYFMKNAGYVTVNGGWSSVNLGNEERKFQGSGWFDLYDTYSSEITTIITNHYPRIV